MPLRKQKGNMYDWITHTWNPVKGKCSHNCSYCYVRKWGTPPPLRLDEKELSTNLGSGNFIFVCSGCDLFAQNVKNEWIHRTLEHMAKHDNQYLIQSKNPKRFYDWYDACPPRQKIVFATTIESDIFHKEMGRAPDPYERSTSARIIREELGLKTVVTIEPIMQFDHNDLVYMMSEIKPCWINIGANTNHTVKLPEPNSEKIRRLIESLEEMAEVKIKPNLKRLLGRT